MLLTTARCEKVDGRLPLFAPTRPYAMSCCLPLILWLSGYNPKKGVRLHDGNAAERTDVRQVVITGNDEIGLAFQCAGQYLVVLGVIVDFVHFHRPGNKVDDLRKGPEEPVNLLRRCFVNLLKFRAKKGSL